MPSPAAVPQKNASLAYVDALRGIAILGVICCHCFYTGMPWFLCRLNVAQWVMSGRYGVQLFFVASAFTLAWSWNRRKMECHPIRSFLIRRYFRIAPLYLLGIAAYAILASFVFPNGLHGITAQNYTPQSILSNALFIHGWLPFAMNNVVPGGWSIGVEMSFYLLVPWLAMHLVRPARALGAFALAIPLAFGAAWGAHQIAAFLPTNSCFPGLVWPVSHDNTFFYFWLPTQLPVFLLGFFAYGILSDPKNPLNATPHKKAASAAILFFGLLAFWAVSLCMFENRPAPEWIPAAIRPHYSLISPTLAGICACALLLSLALHPWRLFVNPLTVFLGKISYSLYIVHFIGAWALAPWIRDHSPWVQTQPWGTLGTFAAGLFACLAFAIPLAMLTHRFIEQPGIALGKRLIERLEAKSG